MTHQELWQLPYLSSPNHTISFEEKVYEPIFFTFTRGGSNLVHYVCNYVKDDTTIYFIHGTKGMKKSVLKPVKSADYDSFTAVHWYIAKDKNNVYYGQVRKKEANVSAFRVVAEEMRLYFDGNTYFDKYMKPLSFDVDTFALIPFSASNRKKQWQRYNSYLKSIKQPILPIENTCLYSEYAVDKNALYGRNVSSDHFYKLEKKEIVELLDNPENEDILLFIKENPEIKTFDWYQDLF